MNDGHLREHFVEQDQLKKDIQEWQTKADNISVDSDNFSSLNQENAQNLIDEARTLLLRCSLSL